MEKIRIGIIGTGGRSVMELAKYIPEFSEYAELVALADINSMRLAKAAEVLGGVKKCFADYHEMLNGDFVDAVIVGTPDFTHRKIATDCFRAGKHVLCEKPMATSVEDCKAICNEASKAGKILQIGFCLHYAPLYQELRRIIKAGIIGDVKYIQVGDYYPGGKSYFRRWHRFREQSGGLLIHKGCHVFDLLNWCLNDRPVRVGAFGGTEVFKPDSTKPGCCNECSLECPDRADLSKDQLYADSQVQDPYPRDLCLYNSEKTSYDNSVVIIEYAGGARVSYGECFFTTAASRFFLFAGEKGELRLREDMRTIWHYDRHSGMKEEYEVIEASEGGHCGGDQILVRDFIQCIRENRSVQADGEAGTLAVAIGEAAEISAEEKRIVAISELIG